MLCPPPVQPRRTVWLTRSRFPAAALRAIADGQPNDEFGFGGGVWSSRGLPPTFPQRCIEVAEQTAALATQIWSKPQPGGAVAVFLLNGLDQPTDFTVHLAKDLGLGSDTAIAVRDIWEQRPAAALAKGATVFRVPRVPSRDSRFFLLTPDGAAPSGWR